MPAIEILSCSVLSFVMDAEEKKLKTAVVAGICFMLYPMFFEAWLVSLVSTLTVPRVILSLNCKAWLLLIAKDFAPDSDWKGANVDQSQDGSILWRQRLV